MDSSISSKQVSGERTVTATFEHKLFQTLGISLPSEGKKAPKLAVSARKKSKKAQKWTSMGLNDDEDLVFACDLEDDNAFSGTDWSPDCGNIYAALRKSGSKSKTFDRSSVLTQFKTLKLRDMRINEIDANISMFSSLEELSLGGNFVKSVPSAQLPRSLKVLSLYANGLEEFPDLLNCPHLHHLGLGMNSLTDDALRQSTSHGMFLQNKSGYVFESILSLDLSYNIFSDLEGVVDCLLEFPKLRVLCLMGNPISLLHQYRVFVIHNLPGLLSLDDRPITDAERRSAAVELDHILNGGDIDTKDLNDEPEKGTAVARHSPRHTSTTEKTVGDRVAERREKREREKERAARTSTNETSNIRGPITSAPNNSNTTTVQPPAETYKDEIDPELPGMRIRFVLDGFSGFSGNVSFVSDSKDSMNEVRPPSYHCTLGIRGKSTDITDDDFLYTYTSSSNGLNQGTDLNLALDVTTPYLSLLTARDALYNGMILTLFETRYMERPVVKLDTSSSTDENEGSAAALESVSKEASSTSLVAPLNAERKEREKSGLDSDKNRRNRGKDRKKPERDGQTSARSGTGGTVGIKKADRKQRKPGNTVQPRKEEPDASITTQPPPVSVELSKERKARERDRPSSQAKHVEPSTIDGEVVEKVDPIRRCLVSTRVFLESEKRTTTGKGQTRAIIPIGPNPTKNVSKITAKWKLFAL